MSPKKIKIKKVIKKVTKKKDPKTILKANQHNDDTLSWYLKEINKISLLTRDEEKNLCYQMAQGSEKAKDKLINANLRFVVSIAKRYQTSGLSLLDLINEGNAGLLEAAKRFDYTRKYHFISYAVWWIKQSILKALSQKNKLIRLPANRQNELLQIENVIEKLSAKFHRRPTAQEIAEELDMSDDDVDLLLNVSNNLLSLDERISDDVDSLFLGDTVEDTHHGPEKEAFDKALKDTLNEVLSTLSENGKCV